MQRKIRETTLLTSQQCLYLSYLFHRSKVKVNWRSRS